MSTSDLCCKVTFKCARALPRCVTSAVQHTCRSSSGLLTNDRFLLAPPYATLATLAPNPGWRFFRNEHPVACGFSKNPCWRLPLTHSAIAWLHHHHQLHHHHHLQHLHHHHHLQHLHHHHHHLHYSPLRRELNKSYLIKFIWDIETVVWRSASYQLMAVQVTFQMQII